MAKAIEFENIEELRRQEGIDDIELMQEISGLQVGDSVKLTLLTGGKACDPVLVRITSIRGSTYRGKLTHKPAAAGLSHLTTGTTLNFTAAHIHSVVKASQVKS